MARWLAWMLWVAAVGCLLGGLLLIAISPAGNASYGGPAAFATAAFVLSFSTVGAIVARRRPENAVGWILLAVSLSYAGAALGIGWVASGWPGLVWADWGSSLLWPLGTGLAATLLLLLFPDGRLPSRRWRPAAWSAAAAISMGVGAAAFRPVTDLGAPNPAGLNGGQAATEALSAASVVIAGVCSLLSLVSLGVRFRRSRGRERQQLKWLLSAAALVIFAFLVEVAVQILWEPSQVLVDVTNAVIAAALAAIPIAMGIAILRLGLFDIDRLISRTLSYTLLTAALVGVYVSAAVLPAVVFDVRSDLLVAGGTLAAAAAVGPLRRRVQSVVDRRFNRARYDARQAVEGLRSSLRDAVDLDEITEDVRRAVVTTVQPVSSSLWLTRRRWAPAGSPPREVVGEHGAPRHQVGTTWPAGGEQRVDSAG